MFGSGVKENWAGAPVFDFIEDALIATTGEFDELVAFKPFATQLFQAAFVKM